MYAWKVECKKCGATDTWDDLTPYDAMCLIKGAQHKGCGGNLSINRALATKGE